MSRFLPVLGAVAVVSLLASPFGAGAAAQGGRGRGGQPPPPPAQQTQVRQPGEIVIVPVQGNVYMLVGDGPNVVVQAGPDGALVIDPGPADMSSKVLAAVRSINKSTRPIQYVLNTQYHADHNGGNELVAAAGKKLSEGGSTSAPVIAYEMVLRRMSAPTGEVSPRKVEEQPTDPYNERFKDLYFNGEPIQLYHEPDAVTDGDTIVFFRHSDVIATGDIFMTTSYPVIDLKAGGTLNGVIAGLNHVLELTVPAEKQEDGTLVVPGHGRLCDEADVAAYRNMLTIIRDRIADAVRKGKTLEQVKAAKLTLDYDGRYGATTGPWTTDMFVEAAYKTLSAKGEGK